MRVCGECGGGADAGHPQRCSGLNNYATARSILAALDSSTIARLQQTWVGLPAKHHATLECLRKLADHSRNYHEYRTRLRNAVPPAVPFLGACAVRAGGWGVAR
jgi:son of sevenless-like protein